MPLCTQEKEQDGEFRGDLRTHPTACPADAGPDGACEEGPRLLLDCQAVPNSCL